MHIHATITTMDKDAYRRLVEPNLGYVGNMLRWGASVEKICTRLGVSTDDFDHWLATEPELAEVARSAMMQRDEDIQRAFFEAAVGGFHTDIKKSIKKTTAPDGSDGYTVTEETQTLHWVKADPKLMALMLKNTDPTFVEEDKFRRDLETEAHRLRRELLSASVWVPVDGKQSDTRKRSLVKLSKNEG